MITGTEAFTLHSGQAKQVDLMLYLLYYAVAAGSTGGSTTNRGGNTG